MSKQTNTCKIQEHRFKATTEFDESNAVYICERCLYSIDVHEDDLWIRRPT